MSEENKALVRRLVEEAVNDSNSDVLNEIAEGEIAAQAKRWIGPFRKSFPDFHLATVELIAEGDKVAAHFTCSGTHMGEWRGNPPTGRRFEGVDEIYIFKVKDGRLRSAVAVEDDLSRMRQLGLT